MMDFQATTRGSLYLCQLMYFVSKSKTGRLFHYQKVKLLAIILHWLWLSALEN